jgi:hypothetical protein
MPAEAFAAFPAAVGCVTEASRTKKFAAPHRRLTFEDPMVPWPFLFIGAALIVLGSALASNWRHWSDRYAAWNRSTWGRLAGWTGSASGTRGLGVFYILFGILLEVILLVFLIADRTRHS